MRQPEPFAPSLDAARARIAAVRPSDYARSRNALDGAVSRLSPYITHGFVTLPEVLGGVAARHSLHVQHKFVFELGWREYFHHVWQHRGDAILRSLHPGPLPDEAYSRELPDDIRSARTGVPVIDQAVRALYATGYLHNHARMWLASYLVHLRKVHWRAGADWMFAHLLDGDLASNHLSWQWVAGTGSKRPYLFNAENVARYAPAPWHSAGTLLDTSYEALDAIARDPQSPGATVMATERDAVRSPRPESVDGPRKLEEIEEPKRSSIPPAALVSSDGRGFAGQTHAGSMLAGSVLAGSVLAGSVLAGSVLAGSVLAGSAPAGPTQAADVAGRDVWLVHPWALGELPADLPADCLRLGWWPAEFHAHWPWSEARWRFVGARMSALAGSQWHCSSEQLAQALSSARSVQTIADFHLRALLPPQVRQRAPMRLFPTLDVPCASFSAWWTRCTRGMRRVSDLPGLSAPPAHGAWR